MELSYWISRWEKDKIGFHMPGGYPGLETFWNRLKPGPNPHVLVPLCGKAVDLLRLESFGATVTGVEISGKAITDFFAEHQRSFETESFGKFIIRRSGNIQIWQGDFLKFPENKKPEIDLIYDKSALTALPPQKREQYAQKLLNLSSVSTCILLHHFIYPQEQMPGPPFSTSELEIEHLFSGSFVIQVLEESTIPAVNFHSFQRRGLKSSMKERLLYLNPHS